MTDYNMLSEFNKALTVFIIHQEITSFLNLKFQMVELKSIII